MMHQTRLTIGSILLLVLTLVSFGAAADMIITLRDGKQVRLPYGRSDIARIEYTDAASTGSVAPPAQGNLPPAVTGGTGTPWVVNSNGNIYRRTGSGWQPMPGLAKDIGVGANGAVWVIGTDATGGGWGIHYWTGSNWSRVDGGAVRIAVAPDGSPWVVNSNANIYRRSGNSWQLLPGLARDIGIGANGAVWVIGTDATAGGFGIHQWNGSGWTRIEGGAVRIAVAADGQPWVVNSAGNIFRRTGSGWQTMPGLARDIGVGAQGAVWVIGTDSVPGGHGIYTWDGSTWVRIEGGATDISVQ